MKFYLYEIKYRIGEYLNNGDAQLFYDVPPDCDIHVDPYFKVVNIFWASSKRLTR